ncbi:DUF2958 domain-containing protein [Achromobacter mucicolens]|uniref:DUF2958 domain-containing protein n=1 Tax=Achromobacter mucicolens TaxID=1389922 RepID=A0ABD4YX85_9BURK|nr:DUF2958 domain-containing protein [Achromobacter mucicolens]MDH1180082.1 DUF2958 domain-containing protein [Achromobacter mucicolens]
MPLLTDVQHAQLLAQGRQCADDPGFDPVPAVKLYTPDAGVVWLLAYAYPDDPRRVHGLCDANTGFPQRTDIHLDELEALRGPNGYRLAVDTSFNATRTLSDYAARAEAQGAYTED